MYINKCAYLRGCEGVCEKSLKKSEMLQCIQSLKMEFCEEQLNLWNQINPLKTSPEYTRAGVYGKFVLQQIQIILNGLKSELSHPCKILWGDFIKRENSPDPSVIYTF